MSNGIWKMTKSIEIGPKKELKQLSIPPLTKKVTNGLDRWSMFFNLGNICGVSVPDQTSYIHGTEGDKSQS